MTKINRKHARQNLEGLGRPSLWFILPQRKLILPRGDNVAMLALIAKWANTYPKLFFAESCSSSFLHEHNDIAWHL